MKNLSKFILILIVISSFNPLVYAEEASTEDKKDHVKDCRDFISDTNKIEEPKLENFINQQFSSGLPNSELINDAMSNYNYYIDQLELALNTWASTETTKDLTEKSDLILQCQILIEHKKEKWSLGLKEKVIVSSQGKRTTLLIDRYKRINEKLRELNLVLGMLKAYIEGFALNLPCYVNKCQTK